MAATHVLSGLLLALLVVVQVSGHETPCNVNNATRCTGGVQHEFVRNDTAYWFGSNYAMKCPNGYDGTFMCWNPNPDQTSIAQRLLGPVAAANFDETTIEQFLKIYFNVPAGSYVSCGHRFEVPAFQSTREIDNTHTLYYDMWTMDWRPTIMFDYTPGELYTLIAYDAGYQRIGGMWVNIMSSDTATGEEVIPHYGPVNPMWQKRNPFVYALFRQHNAERITAASTIRADILTKSLNNDGQYYLADLITNYNLQGPIGVGYLVVKADAFGILAFNQRNIFNNCPYLVSKNRAIMMALRVLGYEFTDKNSYTDYRGTFLTHLEVDMTVRYHSKEAHFDSCCKHTMYKEMEKLVDPFTESTLHPIFTRDMPDVTLKTMEPMDHMYFKGKMFTLLLLDVTEAAVNATNQNTVVHWHVANFMSGYLMFADTVRSYRPPLPMGNETRQFLFLLLKQHGHIDAHSLWPHTGPNCPHHLKDRCHFDFGTFQRSLHLDIVGLSHFKTEQDPFTRAVLYGAISPHDVAESMPSFMARPAGCGANPDPMMSMADVCEGVEGYMDPCPVMDHSGHDHSGHDHSGHDHSGHDHSSH